MEFVGLALRHRLNNAHFRFVSFAPLYLQNICEYTLFEMLRYSDLARDDQISEDTYGLPLGFRTKRVCTHFVIV